MKEESTAPVARPVARRASPTASEARTDELEERVKSLEETVADLLDRTAHLEALVGGRNRSAATKRNMTDADALRVLTGDLKELVHKDAAEVGGLTYAQVYSCRKEFTFKHVHKELRTAKWKNPWCK